MTKFKKGQLILAKTLSKDFEIGKVVEPGQHTVVFKNKLGGTRVAFTYNCIPISTNATESQLEAVKLILL